MAQTNDNSLQLLKRLGKGYLSPHKKRITIALVCMVLVAAATGLFAHMIEPLVDKVFVEKNLGMLFIVPLVMIVLVAVKGIASFVQAYLMEFVGQRVIADLQIDLYRHITHQDMAFFARYPTSDLTSRFIYDLQRLNQATSRLISGGPRDLTMVLGLSANLFAKDWQLAIVSLIIFPMAIVPISRFGKLMRKYARASQELTGSLSKILVETFGYQRQVKSYTMEDHEVARATGQINSVFRMVVKAAKVRALSSPVMEFIGTFAAVIVIFFAGWRAYSGELTTGAFLSFFTSLLLLFRPIKGLTNLNNALQEGLAAAERAFTLMDESAQVIEKDKAKPLSIKKANVEFKDVSYSYPDGTKALEHLNLKIPAGKMVALVGASGAGKSTTIDLLCRFADVTEGKITINKTDIRDITLTSLRQNIALVTQDVAIFDDTVFNNIAYGNPEATLDDVIAAAKAAAAHDFIEKLENGYETRLGEAGEKLSGGQKQRISIARALVKDAPILLLDEATSSLDTESEKKVQKALDTLMKGRTTLVVAHRLSTIIKADNIVVLDSGHIAEEGTHKQLLAQKGLYAKLSKLQSTQ